MDQEPTVKVVADPNESTLAPQKPVSFVEAWKAMLRLAMLKTGRGFRKPPKGQALPQGGSRAMRRLRARIRARAERDISMRRLPVRTQGHAWGAYFDSTGAPSRHQKAAQRRKAAA